MVEAIKIPTPNVHDLFILDTIANTFHGAILWEFCVCMPEDLAYIFWPEIVALFQRGKPPSIPSLL